jgi:hypothetical protein
VVTSVHRNCVAFTAASTPSGWSKVPLHARVEASGAGERVAQLRLDAIALSVAPDWLGAQAQLLRQDALAPAHGWLRLIVRRQIQNPRRHVGSELGRIAGARRLLVQSGEPALRAATAPESSPATTEADLRDEVLVLLRLPRAQDDGNTRLELSMEAWHAWTACSTRLRFRHPA